MNCRELYRFNYQLKLLSVLLTLITSTLIILAGCTEPPQCTPGQEVECPCLGGLKGIQRCEDDGSRFSSCRCLMPEGTKSVIVSNEELLEKLSGSGRLSDKKLNNRFAGQDKTLSTKKVVEPNQASDTSDIPRLKSIQSASGAVTKPLLQSNSSTNKPSAKKLNENALKSKTQNLSSVPKDQQVIRTVKKDKVKKTEESPKATQTSRKEPLKRKVSSVQKEARKSLLKPRRETPWWLASKELNACLRADDVNGRDLYPSKMLASACYTKSTRGERLVISCPTPPLGPNFYHYASSQTECNQLLTELQAKVDPPPPLEVSRSNGTKKKSIQRDQTWHCMCYQERYRGKIVTATACRNQAKLCTELEEKVSAGSSILVKGSIKVGCQVHKAVQPWNLFGAQSNWIRSTHEGSWWSPSGCFLKQQKRAKKRESTQRMPKKRVVSNRASVRKKVSPPKKKVSPPIVKIKSKRKRSQRATVQTKALNYKANSCQETCWAHLSGERERARKYHQQTIPANLKWGERFASSGRLTVRTCIAQRLGQGNASKRCQKEGVKACVRFCKRSKS